MSFRKLPVELRKRITDYYENRYQGKMFNEEQIKAELNPSLRQELLNASCRELLDAVPMFWGINNNLLIHSHSNTFQNARITSSTSS